MSENFSYTQWELFRKAVMFRSRHVLDPDNQRFLERLAESAQSRSITAGKGTRLWRAQIGSKKGLVDIDDGWGIPIDKVKDDVPFGPKRMKPLRDRAKEGRVNPKGIPCLYLADNIETATAEVRPWVGANVSVALFKTKRTLKLLDCTKNETATHDETETQKQERRVWREINRHFSLPVTSSDDTADYAPTQFIAERVRQSGFNGILYMSQFDNGKKKGKNVALFQLKDAVVVSCQLLVITKMKLESADVP